MTLSADGQVDAASADVIFALSPPMQYNKSNNQQELTLAVYRRVLQSDKELSAEEFERQF